MRPVDSLAALVGQTPLLEIRYRFNGEPRRLFAKYETMNMTGSVKDRMALHILRRARERGELQATATSSPRPPAATPAFPSPPSAGRWAIACESTCRTG